MADRNYKLLIDVNTSAARQSLAQLNKELSSASGNFKKATTEAKSAEKGFGAFGGAIQGIVATLGGAGLISKIATTTARYEDLQTTLNSVTGSAEKGAQAFDFINRFATQTQFGVEDLTQTFIKLSAAGITPTEKLLTTFTDAAAVTTDQIGSLQAITDLFARTTQGGLGLEEINRLTDRGIPALDILNEKLGISRQDISEFGKTAAGAKTIVDALAQGINERFGGATQERLNNLSTSMSNFGIAIDNAIANIGKGSGTVNSFSGGLSSLLNTMTGLLSTSSSVGQAISVGFGAAFRGAEAVVRTFASLLQNEVVQAVGAVTLAWKGLSLAISLSPIGRAVALVSAAFVALGQVIDNTIQTASGVVTVGTYIQATFNVITNRITTIAGMIGAKWTELTSGMFTNSRDFVNKVLGVFYILKENSLNIFRAMATTIRDLYNGLISGVATVAGYVSTDLQNSINGLSFDVAIGEVKSFSQIAQEAFSIDHVGKIGESFNALVGPGGPLELVSTSLKNDINAELVRLQKEAEAAKASLTSVTAATTGAAPVTPGAPTSASPAAATAASTAYKDLIKSMEQELKLAGMTNRERQLQMRIIEATKAKQRDLGDATAQLTAQEIQQLTELENKIHAVNQAKEEQERLNQEMTQSWERLGRATADWASGTKNAIKAVVAELLRMSLLRMFGGTNPLVSGFLSGLGGANFGGRFAMGGTAPANKVSLVGENGPELIYPTTAMNVVPNHKLGGANIVVTPTLTINGGVNGMDDLQTMFTEFSDQIANQTHSLITRQLQPRGVFF